MNPFSYTLVLCMLWLCACDTVTPEQYFMRAALNCNLMYGFAGDDMQRDLASLPKQMAYESAIASHAIKGKQVVEQKIALLEMNHRKVLALQSQSDAADMVKASLALYEYVLPVYKNEYLQLANLYDEGASASKIAAMENYINYLYEARFLELYQTAWQKGREYATRHGIQVKEVHPEPPQ